MIVEHDNEELDRLIVSNRKLEAIQLLRQQARAYFGRSDRGFGVTVSAVADDFS